MSEAPVQAARAYLHNQLRARAARTKLSPAQAHAAIDRQKTVPKMLRVWLNPHLPDLAPTLRERLPVMPSGRCAPGT